MTDPRNIAHDKKVQQEKKHNGEEIAPGAEKAVQPGRKPHMESHETKPEDTAAESDSDKGADQSGR